MRKVIYSALIAFFLLVALLSSLVIYQHFKDSEEQADIYEEIANLVSQNETGNQEPAENPTTDVT